MNNRLWVIEMNVSEIGIPKFQATVGVGLSREDGRKKLSEWRRNNPQTSFRLTHYVPVSWRTVRK